MVKTTSDRQRGFSLVEITIALAITGLILVMVFMALGEANKSSRDGQRKADLDKVVVQLNSYANNHNDAFPNDPFPTAGTFAAFWGSSYITGLNLTDPSGSPYIEDDSSWPTPATTGTFYYRITADCAGNPINRGYSIKLGLESGESCRDSQ